MKEVSQTLVIEEVSKETQEHAKHIVLDGLKERYGSLDKSLNQDLNEIVLNYNSRGNPFLVGRINTKVVCTGALIREDVDTGRIVRMSVQKEFRRHGIAQKMLKEIERRAQAKGFKRIVLETTNSWHDAISFYKKNEYKEVDRNEYEVHMAKNLFSI
ncbi:GNAT family N-acetyltransferase [Paenibacillus lautus]|uniref:GNAT family N-acetyltransferase n=1 Tax=Paenibacillus lautus TaxID=1401 RepID=UPI003D26F625